MPRDAAGIIAERSEILLQRPDRVTFAAVAQKTGRGGGSCGGVGNPGLVVELFQRLNADDAVCVELVAPLELDDGFPRLGAEMTGYVAGIELELLECALNGRDLIGFVAHPVVDGERRRTDEQKRGRRGKHTLSGNR